MTDPLIAQSARRVKVIAVLAVMLGVLLAALNVSLSAATFGWTFVVLLPMAAWATWPAQVYHYRQYKQRRL